MIPDNLVQELLRALIPLGVAILAAGLLHVAIALMRTPQSADEETAWRRETLVNILRGFALVVLVLGFATSAGNIWQVVRDSGPLTQAIGVAFALPLIVPIGVIAVASRNR